MTDTPENDKIGDEKTGERIAKAIARAGLASRREAETWIADARVAINGTVISSPAVNVTASDRITVDGAPLPLRERTRLFLYHKPRGLMTSHADPEGRPTIFERLPQHLPRLISVGRLDFNTEGLLLLTNDGALARVLELPSTGWLRRYRVRAHGTVTQPQLNALRQGITVDGIQYGGIDAELDRVQGSNVWLTFAIREGKNREVRNVLGHLGLTVTRLIRLSFGPFQLGELKEGEVEEVRTRVLREQLGERIAKETDIDFSGPLVHRDAEEPPPEPHEPAPSHDERPRRDEAPRRRQRERFGDRPRRDETAKHERQGRSPEHGQERAQERGDEKKPRRRTSTLAHSWRASEVTTPKKLHRKFRGGRSETTERERGEAKSRAGLLTDRKGRRILIERIGEKKPPEPAEREFRGPPRRFDDRRPPREGSESRPPRKFDDRRPPREGGESRPPRKFDDRRTPREGSESRPPRKFDARRPPREGSESRPPRKFDDRRTPRGGSGSKPPQRPYDNKPHRPSGSAPPRRPKER